MKLEHCRKSRNKNDSKIRFPVDKGNCHVFSFHKFYVEKEGAHPICSFVLTKIQERGAIFLTAFQLGIPPKLLENVIISDSRLMPVRQRKLEF